MQSYADDTQLYFPDKAESCERRLPRFTECIAAIERWMTANRLKMKTDSVVVLGLGPWPLTVLKDTSEVLGLGLES